ncbi:unnamed protein product, partial [Medioppia subpectinata]
ESYSFDEFFKCPKPSTSQSTAGRRAMNVMLVLLLLSLVIVIVIAVVVAFVKHRNNQSKTNQSTDKNDKDIASNDLIIQTKTNFLKLKNCIDKDYVMERFPSRAANFVDDKDMWNSLHREFDLSKPVFGFTFRFVTNDCGRLDTTNECTKVYDDSQIFYSCLYGHHINTRKVKWIANKYNDSRIMTINTFSLWLRVKKYCEYKWKHNETMASKEGFLSGVSFRLPHPSGGSIGDNRAAVTVTGGGGTGVAINTSQRFIAYYEDRVTYQIYTSESMANPNSVNLLGYQFCKVFDTNLTADYLFGFNYNLPKDYVYYVFRYLNLTWSCGQNCSLDTPLSLIELNHKFTTSFTSQMFGTYQSLNTLFGCGKYFYESEPSFKPNDFCETDQRLESVFGLGNDLYFQNNAKFWKWSDVSFKSGANPGIKSEPIFFDSDFTTSLNKFQIDTTKPVMGFTFKLYSSSTSNVNECLTNADTIRCQLYLSPHYYRACIYGEVIDNTNKTIGKLKDSFERKAFAFQYTPSGLKAFPVVGNSDSKTSHSVFSETQIICDNIRNAFAK